MSKVFTSILILSTIALADPTHFLDGKWYSCDKTEYDSKGNEIYDKNADGSEHWIIYDEKGHLFQMKSTAKDLNDTIIKTITTYKTDARGNVIYSKDSFGTEKWNEYNKWNKLTRIKDNTGLEILNEYDKKGNMIHTIMSRDSKKISETWYDNDNKGNLIHSRFLDGSEAWYSEGKIILRRDADGSEKHYKHFKEKTPSGTIEYLCEQE